MPERTNRQLLARYLARRTRTADFDELCERTGPTPAIGKSVWLRIIGRAIRCQGSDQTAVRSRIVGSLVHRLAAEQARYHAGPPSADDLASRQHELHEALSLLDAGQLAAVEAIAASAMGLRHLTASELQALDGDQALSGAAFAELHRRIDASVRRMLARRGLSDAAIDATMEAAWIEAFSRPKQATGYSLRWLRLLALRNTPDALQRDRLKRFQLRQGRCVLMRERRRAERDAAA